ncbi:MAG TPA: 5-carboxymethyl-2-hydroxymuconate isomerase [Magnetospirillum sp.]|nr:5-carboxymethyl-2-hydroxymuconate isomerase [Magnetospirillum sp.]
MPQIRIEYSQGLASAFDRRAFALALHPLAADLIGSALSSFKTRFIVLEETVIGDGAQTHAMVHIDFRLLSGRPPEIKQTLGRAVLDLARQHVAAVPGLDIQITVEVGELDRPHYHKAVASVA